MGHTFDSRLLMGTSVFAIIMAIANIAMGSILMMQALEASADTTTLAAFFGFWTSSAESLDDGLVAMVTLLVGCFVLGAAQLYVGIQGILGAGGRRGVMPAWYASVIVLDLAVIGLAVMLVNGSLGPASIPLVVTIAALSPVLVAANRMARKPGQKGVGTVRGRIYELVEGDGPDAKAYGVFMIFIIIASLAPLCFKESYVLLDVVEYICVAIFIVDYAFRLATADLKLNVGRESFLLYPITPMAIIDLLSILPTFFAINPTMKALRIVRLVRVIRAFKIFRYLHGVNAIARVFIRHKKPLLIIQAQAFGYVFVSALVVFNVEPETFNTFFDALYWAVVSLTTVGYGDLYPVTDVGRVISMVSSLVGVAIVALPSGVIMAGLLEEFRREEAEERAARLDSAIERAGQQAGVRGERPAEEISALKGKIARAKAMLDDGLITEEEFSEIKARIIIG